MGVEPLELLVPVDDVDRVVEERCFLPIHVYDTVTNRPVTVLLRPGKTPSGNEIRDSRMVPAVSR